MRTTNVHRAMSPDRCRRLPASTLVGVRLVLAMAVAWLALVSPVAAEWNLSGYEVSMSEAAPKAGSHSDFKVAVHFESPLHPIYGIPMPEEQFSTIVNRLPAGFIGNAAKFPTCSRDRFEFAAQYGSPCPKDTQVGEVVTTQALLGPGPPDGIYNIEPGPGEAAKLGLLYSGQVPIYITIDVRNDSDYGLVSTTSNIQNLLPVTDMEFNLWGVPARHNGSGAPEQPFMTYPTDCASPLDVGLKVRSYEQPDRWIDVSSPLPTPTGCEDLAFEPTIEVTPDTTAPDTPTGLVVDLAFPQNDDPDGLSTPALRKAEVQFPEGMTINPGAADGLAACTDAEAAIGAPHAASCPNGAKIGTVQIDVPALRKPLDGAMYIGTQQSDDPASGRMFRGFLVADGQGIHLKLAGEVRADPVTGRLTATFDNNPQVPASSIKLRLKGGPRAVLVTPPTCGPKTVGANLASWGGPTVDVQSTFTVDCVPGLGGFLPSFAAGTVTPTSGASTPFTLKVHKPDTQADLNGLRLAMPEGLLATIKGNLGARVGTATVAAGPGTNPYYLSGPVVLEGPYGDAPYSLRVTVPAKAGPFDLGDVVVRQKIYVDPHDARVTVVSDPLPTIVKGVPVRLQKLDVVVDKPGFMRNPTSCAEKQVIGALAAVGGQTATVSSRFQVGGCDKLPFQPQLTMAMTDRKATKQGRTTPFVATVKQAAGETGIKKAVVSLPPTLALMTKNAKALCTPEQAAAHGCPEGSIVGSASAVTPLLAEKLSGPVYFVEGRRTTETGRVVATLPKLWVALRGPIAIDLWADSDVKDNRLVNTFGFVPDAPISEFTLKIDGGEHGILAVSAKGGKADVCKATQRADATFDAQSGKQRKWKPRVETPCGYKVVSKKLYSTKAKVRVGGIPGKGRLTISGTGIRKTRRTINASDAATLSPKLTSTGKRLYRERRALRLRVSFEPSAKGSKARSARTTVARPKSKGKEKDRAVRQADAGGR